MSHEVAKTLYQANHEAGQKFEYFVTGAIGAMFAYSVQNYAPEVLAWNPKLWSQSQSCVWPHPFSAA